MIVKKQPRYSWEDVTFRCECKNPIEVQMERSDYHNPNNKFRHTLAEGWTARVHCAVCKNATGRFYEVRDE